MKKIIFPMLALMLIAVSTTCQEKTNIEEQMQALVDKELEGWNNGNLSLYAEAFSPDFVRHMVDVSEDIIGIEASKDSITETRIIYPDFNVTTDKLIFDGEYATLRWTVTATNTGPLGELPPTGKKIKISGVTISHVVDGKIIEQWFYYNNAAVLTQLGFAITPPETQDE